MEEGDSSWVCDGRYQIWDFTTDSPLGFCPLAHSVIEKLKNLLMNVGWLLSFILTHLELQDINFELDQVDEILQTILEETNLMLE